MGDIEEEAERRNEVLALLDFDLGPVDLRTIDNEVLAQLHRQLHHGSVVSPNWIRRLEAEMSRRGILRVH